MKLTKEEFERTRTDSSFELFLDGIKAEQTKKKYVRTLRKILCDILEDFLDGTLEQRSNHLVKSAKQDPEWTQDLMINLSKMLKARTILPKNDKNYLNPSTIPNYFKPIKKLFDMNNVPFTWKRIYSTFPELNNLDNTREWKREEIQQMLKFTNGAVDRCIILVATSSGIRLGGFELTWDDLTPMYRIDGNITTEITESQEDAQLVCAMIRVYRGSPESYPAFITPETYKALIDHKNEWIREVKREPRPDEPIFKKEGMLPIMASPDSLKKRVERILERSGLRKPLPTGQKRYEVPAMNGFRRFWNKACKESISHDSPLASLIKKEFMMGHSGLISMDRNYFKTHVYELAEEYLNAVPNLTIDDSARLRESNHLKDKKIKLLESEKDTRITDLENIVNSLAKRLDAKP